MRKLPPMLIAFSLACACMAGELRREVSSIAVGTNTVQATTNYVSGISGKINEILVDVIGTGSTGNLSIVVVPELTTMDVRTLYTNVVIDADVIMEPRIQGTALATGAAISGVYDRLALYNETIRIIWTNAGTTNAKCNVVIKYDKGE